MSTPSKAAIRKYWRWQPMVLQDTAVDPDICMCMHFFLNPIATDAGFKAASAAAAVFAMSLEEVGYRRAADWVYKWAVGKEGVV